MTSLSGIKRKTSCYHPSINCESVEIQFVTAGFAEKLKSPLAKTSPTGLKEKKWLVLIRPHWLVLIRPPTGVRAAYEIMLADSTQDLMENNSGPIDLYVRNRPG